MPLTFRPIHRNDVKKPPKRGKKRRAVKPSSPTSIIVEYRLFLLSLCDEVDAIIRETVLENLKFVRGLKTDSKIDDIITEMNVKWRAVLNNTRNRQKLADLDKKVQAHSERNLKISLQSVLGFNPRLKKPQLQEDSARFVTNNVRLIRSIGPRHFAKVEKIINESSANGTRVEEVAAKVLGLLKKRDEKGRPVNLEARATLIARDQILKHNSNLDQKRQKANGIAEFTWRTANDERVRESHAELDGEVFTYAQGTPIGLMPGEDYQCRCYAEPVIDPGMFGPE